MAAFDDKNLPLLETVTDKRKGPRWAHKNEAVSTAILAALQLRAVGVAMRQLGQGEGAAAAVHEEVRDDKNKDYNWCGMFAAHDLMTGGMAGKHLGAMDSTSKVYAFFNYTASHPDVVFSHIEDETGNPVLVKDYHKARSSPRTWIPTADIGKDGLDIRPGDVVTMAVAIKDNRESLWGDHIALVHSYDRATGMLFTIGGNDSGYVVRQDGQASRADQSLAAKAEREQAEAATGEELSPATGSHVGVGVKELKHQPAAGALGSVTAKSHVSGIGRLSLVDYEPHTYYNKKK